MRKTAKLVGILFLCVSSAAWCEESSAPPATKDQLDRLQLDASAITGNQELPRVMYIVPWKESGIGELSGKPVNSLLVLCRGNMPASGNLIIIQNKKG